MSYVHELYEAELGLLELSCANGYVVTQYDLGFPEVRGNVTDRSGGNGVLDYTQFTGSRTVSLAVALDGNVAAVSVLRDNLAAYLQPQRRVEYRIQEPRDTRVRRMLLRGARGGISISHPKFERMTCSWLCASGLLESLDEHSVIVTPTAAEEGRAYDRTYDRAYPASPPAGAGVHNAGNTGAEWVIRMIGALENPTLHLDAFSIDFPALDLTAGQIITIESETHRVFYDDGTPALQYVDFLNSTWFDIPPGDSQFSLTADTFGPTGSATIYWRDSWR